MYDFSVGATERQLFFVIRKEGQAYEARNLGINKIKFVQFVQIVHIY